MSTVTPLPWLPSCGLTTTGRPISCAMAHASSRLPAGRPKGTGTPAARSRFLLRSLSWAMLSDTALVPSTSAAQMRRWRAPQPSCTSEPCVRRRNGMPRAIAAFAQRGDHRIDIDVGGVAAHRGDQALRGLERLAADLLLGVLDDHLVDAGLHRLGAAREAHRATRLRLQRQRDQLEHVRQRHVLLRPAPGFEHGKARAQVGLEARQAHEGALLRLAVHDGFDGCLTGPQVGAAQCPDAGDVPG